MVVDWKDFGYCDYLVIDVYMLCFICRVCDFGFLVVEIGDLFNFWCDEM